MLLALLILVILLDNLHDAFQCGVHNFCSSIFQSLATVGHCMPRASDVASAHDVPVLIALLERHLQGTHDFDLYCPRVAPSVGVVSCTYHHWFMPYSKRRHYCQLPVSGRRMQRFLQFRLASHSLPIVTGRLSGGHYVNRADKNVLVAINESTHHSLVALTLAESSFVEPIPSLLHGVGSDLTQGVNNVLLSVPNLWILHRSTQVLRAVLLPRSAS